MDEIGLQLFEENLERNKNDIDKALSETIQSIALLGLSRTDFFSKAAFYGGTALRILFGLDRFSEDLDFSLLEPVAQEAEKKGEQFRLIEYFTALRDELESFGFSVEISDKQKKISTRIHTIRAGVPASVSDKIHRNAVCKVKLEIDTDPPEGAEYDLGYIDEPVPFSLRSYSGPALLAGKLDAVLSRGWKNRVKGRDWYDFAFLVRKKVPVLLRHLEARLSQKGFYSSHSHSPGGLEKPELIEMLHQRIEAVDFDLAKNDVEPFVSRPRDLEVWSKDYFRHVVGKLECV
jgi:predicted nucleotidyltransferase component of viral defense system